MTRISRIITPWKHDSVRSLEPRTEAVGVDWHFCQVVPSLRGWVLGVLGEGTCAFLSALPAVYRENAKRVRHASRAEHNAEATHVIPFALLTTYAAKYCGTRA